MIQRFLRMTRYTSTIILNCYDTATLALLPTIEVVDELYGEVGSYLPPSLSGASHTHLHLVTQQPRLLCQTSQSWKNEWHQLIFCTKSFSDYFTGDSRPLCILPYSRKIWLYHNRQIKIRQNFLLAYILYIWRSHTEPPNLNPLIFLQ